MQLNGIRTEHNSSSHNVTNCLHEHSVGQKNGGAARSTSLDSLTLSNQNTAQQPEGQISLASWLDKTINSGKDLLQRIWGSDQMAITNGTEGQTTQHAALHTSQAASAVVHPMLKSNIQQNPFFAAVEDAGQTKETLWQKMKVKFKDAAGKLAGHLPGRFAGFWAEESFHTKQEQPREDLRKRSIYRQDELEMDCVLTDDSYLQDSYNKKGEYSRLAGDMRGNMSTRK